MIYLRRSWSLFLVVLVLGVALGCSPDIEAKRVKFYSKGEEFYKAGDYTKASLELRNALQVDPKFAEAYALLGMVHLKRAELRQAFGALSRALELNPNLVDARSAQARIFFLAGEPVRAQEAAEKVLAQKSTDAQALLVKAACLARAGHMEEAETILQGLIAVDPTGSEPYLLLSDIKVKLGQGDAARKVLERFLARNATDPDARAALAKVLESEDKLSDAEAQWKFLAEQDSSQPKPQLQLAGFYARIQRPSDAERILNALVAAHPSEVEYRIQLASFYSSRKQPESAMTTLERAVNDLPDAYEPYEWLARQYLEKEDVGGAARCLEQAVDSVKTPKGLLATQLFLAQVRRAQGRAPEAEEIAEKILKETPGNTEARNLKGDLLMARKDYTGAIAEYRVALKYEPGDSMAMSALARAHVLNNEPHLAEDVFRRALDRDPRMRDARLGLAALYTQQNKPAEAKEELMRVLEFYPDDRMAVAAMGEVALAAKDTAGAKKQMEKLQNLAPDHPQTLYLAGMASRAAGDTKAAEASFVKALQVAPEFEAALIQLVQVRMEKKDTAGALSLAMAQAAKVPGNSLYRVLVGQLQVQSGDIAAARATFEEDLARNINSLESLTALVSLEKSTEALDGAMVRYRERFRKIPSDAASGLLLAVLLEIKGDVKSARTAYEEVLRVKPDAVIAANNLANYYVEFEPSGENLDKVENLIAPLLPKYGSNPVLADTAAWLFYRKGEYARARDLLLAAEGRRGLSPTANYHLGKIYEKLSDKEKSKERLNRAISAKGGFGWRADAELVVKSL